MDRLQLAHAGQSRRRRVPPWTKKRELCLELAGVGVRGVQMQPQLSVSTSLARLGGCRSVVDDLLTQSDTLVADVDARAGNEPLGVAPALAADEHTNS